MLVVLAVVVVVVVALVLDFEHEKTVKTRQSAIRIAIAFLIFFSLKSY